MKKLFLVVILVSSLFASSNRQDDVNLKFTKSSTKLIKADGYSKNITLGKWIKNKNLICDKVVSSKIEKTAMYQNFDYLQLSKLDYNSKDFFTLIVEKDNGYFEYPHIYRNWIPFKETTFLILSKEEINEIIDYISIPRDKPFILKKSYQIASTINNRFKQLGGERAYTKEVLMSNIKNAVINMYNSNYQTKYSYYTFPIFSTLENNKHVIRFKIPVLNELVPNNSIVKDAFSIRIKYDNLEYDYFEVPVAEFKKLFSI